AHVFRQQTLAERVVEFVCAAMEEVFSFEIDIEVVPITQSVGVLERRRSPAEIRESRPKLVHESVLVVEHVAPVGIVEFRNRRHQCFRNVLTTVVPELPVFVRHHLATGYLAHRPPSTIVRVFASTSPSMIALPTSN